MSFWKLLFWKMSGISQEGQMSWDRPVPWHVALLQNPDTVIAEIFRGPHVMGQTCPMTCGSPEKSGNGGFPKFFAGHMSWDRVVPWHVALRKNPETAVFRIFSRATCHGTGLSHDMWPSGKIWKRRFSEIIHQHEFRRIFFPNARKRSTGGFGGGRNAGKRSNGAVLKAKMEITKKYFVSTAGHSKLQKIAFEKICPLNSHFFFSTTRFCRNGPSLGEFMLFLGEEFGSVARLRATPRQNGFCSFSVRKPGLARSSAKLGHGTEFLTQK